MDFSEVLVMSEVPLKCTGIAAILIKKLEKESKVLLLKRAGTVLPDAWCYIGGSIEEGETAWEAALREIKEETGISLPYLYISNQYDQIYSAKDNYIYMAPVFVGYVPENQQVILNHEHSAYKWMSFAEAIETAALPGNDKVLMSVEKHFAKKSPPDFLRAGKLEEAR
jgi:dihydroneopterin triphosphate diphosphatase